MHQQQEIQVQEEVESEDISLPWRGEYLPFQDDAMIMAKNLITESDQTPKNDFPIRLALQQAETPNSGTYYG